MTDLDAIRARHVLSTAYQSGRYCNQDATDWPCDTAIVLAAYDERRDTTEALNTLLLEAEARWTAALERERRLVFALDTASDPHSAKCATGVEAGCDCPLSEARAALAETTEAT